MRLLSVDTFEVREFQGDNEADVPHYAALSHTWGAEELTFGDMNTPEIAKTKRSFEKIAGAAQIAKADGLDWLWVDTVCIDKSSSAELSEAINSMWTIYARSAVCIVYLSDVLNGQSSSEDVQASRWLTRGWTLMELLAPRRCEFYAMDWTHIASRESLVPMLQRSTGIGAEYLQGPEAALSAPISEKMMWLSDRQTTREEDMAYCAFGLFDVHMPIIYGEGKERAFARLQREIMQKTDDPNLFPGQSIAGEEDIEEEDEKEWEDDPNPFQAQGIAGEEDIEEDVEEEGEGEDEEGDRGSTIESLFSDNESVSSASSYNPTQKIGIREVSRTLLGVAAASYLLEVAIAKAGPRKSRSHIKGFLRAYSNGLEVEASNSAQAQAARFVFQAAGGLANEILWYLNGEPQEMRRDHSPTVKEKKDLESWLSTIDSSGTQLHEASLAAATKGPDDEGDDDSDEEVIDSVDFPNTEQVKDFLLSSEAFTNLLSSLRKWLKLDGDSGPRPVAPMENESAPDSGGTEMGEIVPSEKSQALNVGAERDDSIQAGSADAPSSAADATLTYETGQSGAMELGDLLLVQTSMNRDRWTDHVRRGVSSVLYNLLELLTPAVPPGHSRLRWRCSCGTALWGDFSDTDAEGKTILKGELDQAWRGSLSFDHHARNPVSSRAPAGPPASGGSQSLALGTISLGPQSPANLPPGASQPSAVPSGHTSATASATAQGHSLPRFMPKYLELCFDTSNHKVEHMELDISTVSSDSALFEMIWDRYNAQRGYGIRRFFLRPKDVHFVWFSVERSNKSSYGAGIHDKPNIYPPKEEVTHLRYHYFQPKVLIPPHVFLHLLHKARWPVWGEHREGIWLRRLPKKLRHSLLSASNSTSGNPVMGPSTEGDDDLAFGWGVHIIDGPNHSVLGFFLAVLILATFLITMLVYGVAHTQEQAFGVGQYLVAIVACLMAAIYFQLTG